MTAYILSYLSGLIAFLVLDGIMISMVILPIFKRHMGVLLRTDINLCAAGLFYVGYVAILLYLVVLPALRTGYDICTLMCNGALFGFAAYMTYELTSMSIIKLWHWDMVIIDILWGTLVTMLTSLVMYYVYAYFL